MPEATQDRSTWPSESALIADMKATYPGLKARPLKEFGYAGFDYGVWSGGEALMPDGLPVFCSMMFHEPDHYDNDVHLAFLAWLEARGWYVENFDGLTHMIVPIALARAL